jgi:transcriptional regulator with XRE-family HTH domain
MKKMKDNEEFYKLVGMRIMAHREAKGLTQQDMADRLEVKKASFSNYERGKQQILLHHFFEIAEILGVKPDRLLKGAR